jgi:ATP-binding cassette subfamily C protein CydD
MTQLSSKQPAEQIVLSGSVFLKRFINQQKPKLWLAVLSGTMATILLLLQWVSFALAAQNIIVDGASIQENRSLLICFAAAVLGQSLLIRLQSHYAQQASLSVRSAIRASMLQQWRRMSPLDLQQQSPGALATQWVEEVEAMDGYFSRYWPQQMLAVISPLLILCTVAYFNWLCAILLMISAPLIPLFMILVGMGAEKLNQKYSTVRQRLSGHFLDRVANLTTLRLLGAQHEVFEEVKQQSERYREVIMKTLKVAFLSSTVLEFFTSVAIASLAIYIGFSLYGAITWGPAESLSLFSGLAILILAPEFFQPLRNLSQYYHDRAAALGAADNLVILMNEAHTERVSTECEYVSKTSDDCKANTTFDANYTLTVENLAVGYEQSKVLFQPLTVSVLSGQMLVVTGESGSGKSTFLNTIAGFLPSLGGHFHVSAGTHSPSSLNSTSRIAYLPQKPWIKNDSIYENLLALAPLASRAQMLEVMEALGLAGELALRKNGLDVLIGEHGQGLSGGQMQRIALARVLLNPAPVVLLDEPTAKLDLQSKAFIMRALDTLKTKVILIIATHDPLLLSIADIRLQLNKQHEIT